MSENRRKAAVRGSFYPETCTKVKSIVISSDLSHFHSLEEAKVFDKNCLKGVAKLDLDELEKGCKACGLTGIQAVILAAKQHKLTSELLDYRTSAERSKDASSVVGYMSAMFYK